MSESLNSWLFAHCSSSATAALDANYDLSDLPYLRGNRVQLLRFMTFRPPTNPNSLNTHIWALIGDRTHCIAARFSRDQVNRFHNLYPLTFTSLKGALLTLTNVRITVASVQVHQSQAPSGATRSGLPYTHAQYSLVLDVKGFSVVSSVNEPVWFSGVKLVTSPNAVPPGCEQQASLMLKFIKIWIRYKLLRSKPTLPQKLPPHPPTILHPTTTNTLPTPAQTITNNTNPILVPSSTQLIQPHQQQHNPSQLSSQSVLSPTSPTQQPDSSAMWSDFDLDTHIDTDVHMPHQWVPSISPIQLQTAQAAPNHNNNACIQSHLPVSVDAHPPVATTSMQARVDVFVTSTKSHSRTKRKRALAQLMAQIVD